MNEEKFTRAGLEPMKKNTIVSQVRNSMEMKLGQSFQLSEVKNKSEPLQKYIHTMQMNWQFIVTLV